VLPVCPFQLSPRVGDVDDPWEQTVQNCCGEILVWVKRETQTVCGIVGWINISSHAIAANPEGSSIPKG
jgi:hypothetical protein